MRAITNFVCQQCGYTSPQWLGKCPECGIFNSFVETVEEVRGKGGARGKRREGKSSLPQLLSEVQSGSLAGKHISTGFTEFDRVLGGGIVPGSVTLLAGDPGVGKSTLLLQVALNFSSEKGSVLYISGEESAQQIKLRADRLGERGKGKGENSPYILSQIQIEEVLEAIKEIKPTLVIVDSIQTMESENLTGVAGSVGQVRECAQQLIRIAKEKDIPVFLVGHVTKEGTIAGPMILSHMVDTVLFLEGERFKTLRILRGLKNRFGPVDEVGVFEMKESGIGEVKNPSGLFLQVDGVLGKKTPGAVVVATIEGTRPILVEMQALVLPTKLAFPKRVVSGVDARRVELLCAVLQKQANLALDRFDIFVNVAGGLKLSEPGVDLGICLAIVSSLENISLSKVAAVAEVGLLGELREVSDYNKREKEMLRFGFSKIFSAKNYKTIKDVVGSVLKYGKEKN